jgi:putative ABC transport system permease protein
MTPPILAPTLKDNIPEIEDVVRVTWFFFQDETAVSRGDKSLNMRGYFVDPEFLKVFSFLRVAGHPETALESRQGAVITSTMSETYFGSQDPLGQEIAVRMRGGDETFMVMGVVELPPRSSLNFDFLLPFEARGEGIGHWGSNNVYTFVSLIEQTTAPEVEKKFLSFFGNLFQDKREADEKYFGSSDQPLQLLSLKNLYLNTQFRQALTKQSDPSYSYILSGIALAILLIACVNFINLSLGMSAYRSREIGMRKVVGASRIQLMRQYLSETLMLSFLSLFAGSLLTILALPVFGRIMERDLVFSLQTMWFPLIALAVFIGLLAGFYPALVLSGFQPIEVLKGRFQIKNKSLLSSGLVVVQFALSIILIITTMTMASQMRYMNNKDLGFDSEQVILLDGGGWVGLNEADMYRVLSIYRQAVDQQPDFTSVTMANMSFGQKTLWATNFLFEGREIFTRMLSVDYDYLETMGMKLVQGREFSREFPSDRDDSMMINERMARALGFENPIGQRIVSDNNSIFGKIIGVIEDTHLRSLHYDVEPTVYHLKKNNGSYRYFLLRISSDDFSGTFKKIQNIWKQAAPNRPFAYSFLDDEVDRVFKEDQRWADIAQYSALFAILIACMGAFGLISLAVSRRTKEVGIRKVLGASELRIAALLSGDFSRLVLISNLAAWPLAYFILRKWLADFAYRVDLSLAYFVLGAVLTFLITYGAISLQIIRAARANPVDSLRFE